MEQKPFASKRDALIILLLLALATAGLLWNALRPSPTNGVAVVTVDNQEIIRLPLSKNTVYSIPKNPAVIIEIQDGTAFFKQSDCADQICVHTGALSKNQEFAACLPNGVVLQIESENAQEEDVVAR